MRGSKKSRPTLQDDYPQARASQNLGMEFLDWIDGELKGKWQSAFSERLSHEATAGDDHGRESARAQYHSTSILRNDF